MSVMAIKKSIFVVLFTFSSLNLVAQEIFSEGSIIYNITITGKVPTTANEPALTETKSGTVSIYIKGDNVRQDIVLEDGYTHSQLTNYTTGKEIILTEINNLKYAIEIAIADKNARNTPIERQLITYNDSTEIIAGLTTKSATTQSKNGQKAWLLYIEKYQLIHPELFEQFPNLKGIPAKYDLLMANGFTTHFELSALNVMPVQNALFRIPEGYRIISQKEYEKLFR